jgi:uncharacterized membrane protein
VKRVSTILEIQASAEQVYETWKKVEDFPKAVPGLQEVTRHPHGLSTWTARFFGKHFTWWAAISEDLPNTRLRWTSLSSNLDLRGLVELIPADGCCIALVVVEYQPPLGYLGRLAAFLLDVDNRIADDLDRLKLYIERRATPASTRRHSLLIRRREPEEALTPAN